MVDGVVNILPIVDSSNVVVGSPFDVSSTPLVNTYIPVSSHLPIVYMASTNDVWLSQEPISVSELHAHGKVIGPSRIRAYL